MAIGFQRRALAERFLQRRFDVGEAPGIALALVDNGSVHLWSCGQDSPSGGAAMTPATRMPIASLTKPFTAAAALRLVADGLVELDEPVRQDNAGRSVTLRQLLTHTAGTSQVGSDRFTFDQHCVPSANGSDFTAEPGKRFVYSNHGYRIAADVIAERAGTSFEDFVVERICRRLEMNSTNFEQDFDARGSLTRDHEGKRQLAPAVSQYPKGSAGVVSTVDDLSKWLLFWTDGNDDVLPTELRLSAFEKQWSSGEFDLHWGLGFQIVETTNRHLAVNDGHFPGWRHEMVIDLESRKAAVVLTNAIDVFIDAWSMTCLHSLALDDSLEEGHPEIVGLYETAWGPLAIVSHNNELLGLGLDDYEPFDVCDSLAFSDSGLKVVGGTPFTSLDELVVLDSEPAFYGPDEIRKLESWSPQAH